MTLTGAQPGRRAACSAATLLVQSRTAPGCSPACRENQIKEKTFIWPVTALVLSRSFRSPNLFDAQRRCKIACPQTIPPADHLLCVQLHAAVREFEPLLHNAGQLPNAAALLACKAASAPARCSCAQEFLADIQRWRQLNTCARTGFECSVHMILKASRKTPAHRGRSACGWHE